MSFAPAEGGAPKPAALSRTPFDGVAERYDATFTHSAVGRALREIVWMRLEDSFATCRTVLELGCGTGEDALWLARRGISVLATDASASMVKVARAKAEEAGCAERIEFRCIPMEEVAVALDGRSFDGVFSDFGAINCVRDLPALISGLVDLMPRNGKLLWVPMGRHVPWEWAWYGCRGEWQKALRRARSGSVEWRGLAVSYPSPATVTRWLRPSFRIDRVTPLGFALPPTYAAGWLDRSRGILSMLTKLESLARHSSALARLSDHYIIEATRS